MKLNNIELIEDLKERTIEASAVASLFFEVDEQELQSKANPEAWSALECFAHLNRYYAFYIPLLIKAIGSSPEHKGLLVFKAGYLGQFFVRLTDIKQKKIKKMKAMPTMDPNGSNPTIEELRLFIDYQKDMLSILEKSKNYNLSKPKIPTAMSRWITISLGDTLRFIVAHNERHLHQAEGCLKLVPALPVGLP